MYWASAVIVCTVTVSLYFFPFGLLALPENFNTKIGLAVLGIFFTMHHFIRARSISITKELTPAITFAVLFSIVGYISVDYNRSDDYTYANYIGSFGTWMGAAFATYCILKGFHGRVTFKVLINYLIAVCVLQCTLAVLNDQVPALKLWVDTYISQKTIADNEFLNQIDRMYGIGACLDPAGTRFSIVLIAMAAFIADDKHIREKTWIAYIYWIAFFVIGFVGNMISRTTTVGMVMALGYFVIASNLINIEFSKNGSGKMRPGGFLIKMIGARMTQRSLYLWAKMIFIIVIMVAIGAYLYNYDTYSHEKMRYGFEGFFNWLEKGEWRTDSTDKLNNTMWIWPEEYDIKTWIIGNGSFAHFGSDIGYCRFVGYSGLMGLVLFSLFFVLNARACMRKFPSHKLFFLFLLVLTFIIWWKVSTDIFLFYALLYCIDREKDGNWK